MNGAVNVDFNALTAALTTILHTIEQGNDRNADAVTAVSTGLGIIEIVLFAAWIMYGNETLGSVVKKFLALQFWLWFIRGFQGIAKAFMKSMVSGAFSAAGQSGGIQVLLDPSNIAGQGLNATMPLAEHVDSISKLDVGTMMLMGFVLILVMLCFILMATNIAWTVIEFYMYLSLSTLLVPFAIFGATRFLADKAINAIIACSLKLAGLAFVLALIKPILADIDLHQNVGQKLGLSWNDIFAIIMVTFFCLGLCWMAPRVAAGLIHGSPTLSGTGAVLMAAGFAASGIHAVGTAGAKALGAGWGATFNNGSEPQPKDPMKNQSSMGAAAAAGPMPGASTGLGMSAQPIYAYAATAAATTSPLHYQSTAASEKAESSSSAAESKEGA